MTANYPAGFGFKLTQSQIKQARTWDGKKDTAINTTSMFSLLSFMIH